MNSKKQLPFEKSPVLNNKGPFEWKNGNSDTNVVLEHEKLNVQILRYLITSSDGKISYDTIAVKESPNNSVVVIRNEKRELGLIHEWRPIPSKKFWACVRGFADPDDKDNIATAKREMIEEIGNFKIAASNKIGVLYQNTTFFENPVGIILLDVNSQTSQVSKEEGISDFEFFSIEVIKKMIKDSLIEDDFTISSISKYLISEDLI